MSEPKASESAGTACWAGHCPFCGEDDFDLIGLKRHLTRGWCNEFERTDCAPTCDCKARMVNCQDTENCIWAEVMTPNADWLSEARK